MLRNYKTFNIPIYFGELTVICQKGYEDIEPLKYVLKINISLDSVNDEPECYLLTWLVNTVHKFQSACQKELTE